MNNLINISKDKILIFVSHNLNYCDLLMKFIYLKMEKLNNRK